MSRRAKFALVALAIAAFSSFALYIWFSPEGTEDALCVLAKSQFGMNCSILASPGVYEKGAVIDLPEPSNGDSARIGFPDRQIFGGACVIAPGSSDFSSFKEEPGHSVVFGKHEITLNRSVSVGAKLNIPEAASFDLQGGPKISDVRSILLSAESAQIFTIDPIAAQDALNSCNVRMSCTDNISNKQEVVTRLLVAKNL